MKPANDSSFKSAQPEAFQDARYNTNGWFKGKRGKKKKKDLVPAAIMIYGSFKSVSNGVPFWLYETKAWD